MVEKQQINVDSLLNQSARHERQRAMPTDAFIKEHTSLVESIASGVIRAGKVPPCMTFDDLVSWGFDGLLKAFESYDDTKGSSFKTYAYYRIRGQMMDMIRKEWQYRNPQEFKEYRRRIRERIEDFTNAHMEDSAQEKGAFHSVFDIVQTQSMVYILCLDTFAVESESQGTRNPEEEYIDSVEQTEERGILWQHINALEEEERQIVELFYVKGLKQKEISDVLNLSRSKVCRIHTKVLEKLRRRLERDRND